MQKMKLTLAKPDDWHLHLRDTGMLKRTVPDAARQFARAIIMPNLLPAVTTVELAEAYRQRILAEVPKHLNFEPLMTLYLTDNTSIGIIKAAKTSGMIYGCKLYPAGATTHSAAGVTDIQKIYPLLSIMEELGLPLLLHGEITRSEVDVFDREKYFIDEILTSLCDTFPHLKIVLEHISTKEAVEFVTAAPKNIAATVTTHHLLLNRNAIFSGGINPHHYCLPVLKRDTHQQALIKAVCSGHPKFFLGTDSAPHAIDKKETCHGCAGIYSSHAAIELYAEVFEKANSLDKLEAFASFNGADFYGLPRNLTTITLIKDAWTVPEKLSFGDTELRPFRAAEIIDWRIKST